MEDAEQFIYENKIRTILKNFDISAHAGQVIFLDYSKSIKEISVAREYFILLTNNLVNEEAKVDLSKWSIINLNNGYKYELKNILFNKEEAKLLLRKNASIVVSSGKSPAGYSFKINKCTGFKTQFKKFYPNIKTNCPAPKSFILDSKKIKFNDDSCFNFIENIDSCRTPLSISKKLSPSCRNLLTYTLTEDGCEKLYQNDNDFYKNDWRIFLNKENELWDNKNGSIVLIDEYNRIVSALIY